MDAYDASKFYNFWENTTKKYFYKKEESLDKECMHVEWWKIRIEGSNLLLLKYKHF